MEYANNSVHCENCGYYMDFSYIMPKILNDIEYLIGQARTNDFGIDSEVAEIEERLRHAGLLRLKEPIICPNETSTKRGHIWD